MLVFAVADQAAFGDGCHGEPETEGSAASEVGTWKCGVEIEESAMSGSSAFHFFDPRQQHEQLGSRWAINQRY